MVTAVVVSRAIRVTAAIVAVLAACGGAEDKGKTPSGGRASCAVDSDCVVVDTVSCCSPCLEAPRAIPMLAFEQQRNKCAAVECAPASDRIECPKVEPKAAYVARCREHTCAADKP